MDCPSFFLPRCVIYYFVYYYYLESRYVYEFQTRFYAMSRVISLHYFKMKVIYKFYPQEHSEIPWNIHTYIISIYNIIVSEKSPIWATSLLLAGYIWRQACPLLGDLISDHLTTLQSSGWSLRRSDPQCSVTSRTTDPTSIVQTRKLLCLSYLFSFSFNPFLQSVTRPAVGKLPTRGNSFRDYHTSLT